MAEQVPVSPDVVKILLVGACPERAEEITAFWDNFEPRFALKRDGVGSAISASGNKVSWMHKTFAHDWVVAFAGFKTLAAYGPHLFVGDVWSGEISAQALNDDAGLADAEAELDSLLYFARQIINVRELADLDWPAEVPPPGANRETLANVEDKVCFDIACIASAATFLHELRHVQFAADGDAPDVLADEERACDEYSRRMLLEKVDVYCSVSGEPFDQVASKRVIGLVTAVLTIAQAEVPSMGSAIRDSHPPLRDRYMHLVMEANIRESASCWKYVACVLLAQLRRCSGLPQRVQFDSPKHLCKQLVAIL